MTANRDDSRYVAHDDVDAVLLGFYGDEWGMPMGGWTDGDKADFRAAILDELRHVDNGSDDFERPSADKVFVSDLRIAPSSIVTDTAKTFATGETCFYTAQALLNAGGTERKAAALWGEPGELKGAILDDAASMAEDAGEETICWGYVMTLDEARAEAARKPSMAL